MFACIMIKTLFEMRVQSLEEPYNRQGFVTRERTEARLALIYSTVWCFLVILSSRRIRLT